MSIGFLIFCVAPNTAFSRAAGRRLKAQFPNAWTQVWRATRDWQCRLAPSRPCYNAWVNLLMRQMEWSCAL